MSCKLLFIKKDDVVWTALYVEDRLAAVDGIACVHEEKPAIGDIYVGRVGNIVKNIHSAFIEIREDWEPVFIDIKDIEVPACEKAESTLMEGGQPTASGASLKIRQSDELIVQIVKESGRNKRAVASCKINFIGNYLILVHGKANVSVSLKIKDNKRRTELKELAENFIQTYDINRSFGFIIRTNANDASEQDILDEGIFLLKQYEKVISLGRACPAGTRLYREPAAYLSKIRDLNRLSLSEIIVEDSSLYDEVKKYLEDFLPSCKERLRRYHDDLISLSSLYGFWSSLSDALKSKVWLKSGAYLVIEPTEAMVVIDVNTGKSVNGKKSKENTIFNTNMEAAKEIAFQIRLRNLSGIIIIDFIDMEDREHRKLLLRHLKKLISSDSVYTCLVDMTALNLVEITRKKIRRPLHEVVREFKPTMGQ